MDPLTSALAQQYQGQGLPPELDRQRTIGLIAALTGNKQLAGAGDALMGNVQQQQQYAMQAPHMQAQTAKLQQEVQQAGPQQSLGGETPSNFEVLTKRRNVAKYAANPATGALYDVRTGKTAGGGAGGAPAGISGPALDQLAEMFHTTGQLPSMGMGAAGAAARRQIVNRAAELHPDGGLAGNKAAYGADAGSLKTSQKSADSIEAFENTALKNLDAFLTTAKGISDTGIPIANRPIRAIADQLAGSPAQSQFNAARQVAIQEIGKVLGGAVAGGTVTDSQRHEVEGLMRGDATIEQLQAVAQTLRQDMANRKAAVHSQIETIKGRMGGQAAAPTAVPATLPAEPKVRKFTRGPDGKLKEVQ